MAWTVTHNPVFGVIEVFFKGFTTGDDLKTAIAECSALGDETDTARILADTSGLDLGASLFDIMELTGQFVDLDINRLTRIALLQPSSSSARELIQFFETICVNRGWFVKIFTDRQGAIEWLLSASTTVKR